MKDYIDYGNNAIIGEMITEWNVIDTHIDRLKSDLYKKTRYVKYINYQEAAKLKRQEKKYNGIQKKHGIDSTTMYNALRYISKHGIPEGDCMELFKDFYTHLLLVVGDKITPKSKQPISYHRDTYNSVTDSIGIITNSMPAHNAQLQFVGNELTKTFIEAVEKYLDTCKHKVYKHNRDDIEQLLQEEIIEYKDKKFIIKEDFIKSKMDYRKVAKIKECSFLWI
jgi:hypothetical protein